MVEIIAEIGMTHDGSFGQAKAMISAAKDCGATIVKFQTHIPKAETLKSAPSPSYFTDEDRFSYFTRTGFTLEQHKKLFDYANSLGVEFISSPFSIEAIELLEKVGVKTYKVPSGEVTNLPYLEALAKTKKRIILSSGMSSWSELDDAVATLTQNGCEKLIILQCTSEYPCPPEHSGLNIMLEIKERYQCLVGLSDHTRGVGISLAAQALGAMVIEKHFTLSKLMYGPDAKNSLDPSEFKLLCEEIRNIEKALEFKIDKDKKAQELKVMKMTFEKSIVIKRPIKKGSLIKIEDLDFKKPGNGISANRYHEVIGKKINQDLEIDDQLLTKHLES